MLIKKTQERQEVKMILKYMVMKWEGMTIVIINEILIDMTYALSIIIHNIAYSLLNL